MPTRIVLLTFACFVLIGSVFMYSKLNADMYEGSPKLRLPSKEVSLIYVNNSESRISGLSGMKALPDDEAMLFVFEEPGRYGIWMKDMNFPIDIIWLDSHKKIVSIQHDILPETYPTVFKPDSESLYVLETNHGFAKENNFEVGKVLDFDVK
jgi:uncharacterized membrane protein (UPF0127 family)